MKTLLEKLWMALAVTGVLALPAGAQETSAAIENASENVSAPQFLSWEHTLTTRTAKSKNAVAKLKIFNNWTPSRHRILIKYNVLGLGAQSSWMSERMGPAFSMPNFDPSRIAKKAEYHHGTLGLVTRMDDDKLIAYSSESGEHGEYFQENKTKLLKRLRFDPYKKIAPELSKTDPPSLTPEQRARLGAEVRAVLRPIFKTVFKSYFRALPKTRTFKIDGETIEARGYRLAIAMNTGDRYDPQWAHANFEWWLAPSTPQDATMYAFGAKSVVALHELHGPTTSMWMNEMLPVLWQMMPKNFHAALATFLPAGLPQRISSIMPGSIAMCPEMEAMRNQITQLQIQRMQLREKYRADRPEIKAIDAQIDALRESMKEEARTEISSATQDDDSSALTPFLTSGAPLYAAMTFAPPKDEERSDRTGTIRVELQMTKRNSHALEKTVFEAPPEYEKESLEPILKDYEDGIKGLQDLFDRDTRLSDSGVVNPKSPKYSFNALREYLSAVKTLTR